MLHSKQTLFLAQFAANSTMHLKNIIYKSNLRGLVPALIPVTERFAVEQSLPVFMTPDVARLEYSRYSVKPKPIYQQSSSLL